MSSIDPMVLPSMAVMMSPFSSPGNERNGSSPALAAGLGLLTTLILSRE